MNRRPEMIPPLFFIPLPPSNLRPFGAPPSIGRRECPREPLPLEGAAERSEAGLASFFGGEAASSLPFTLGKGDRAAVDRVLSLIVDLRCISSLSFIPLSPSNLRPFGAPPSIGRRDCPREPLPLEGAAERSEAGLASFFGGARVLSYNRALETISPLFFIPLEPYPARSARHLPHAGKALCQEYRFPHPTSAPSGHLLP